MSSGYLTPENMNMIERILESVRAKPMHAYAETSDARFLIAAFQAGTSKESELQAAFDEYREAQRVGGEGPFWLEALNIFKILHRKRLSTLPIPVSEPANPVSHTAQDRPRTVYDTVGAHHRDDEIKSRNQLH